MDVSFAISRVRPGATDGVYPAACATRTVLDHVTSKWGVLILLALSDSSLRWGELRRTVEGISEKMLASTLRTLEADGFVETRGRNGTVIKARPGDADALLQVAATEYAARAAALGVAPEQALAYVTAALRA